jgi:hypothetical protein
VPAGLRAQGPHGLCARGGGGSQQPRRLGNLRVSCLLHLVTFVTSCQQHPFKMSCLACCQERLSQAGCWLQRAHRKGSQLPCKENALKLLATHACCARCVPQLRPLVPAVGPAAAALRRHAGPWRADRVGGLLPVRWEGALVLGWLVLVGEEASVALKLPDALCGQHFGTQEADGMPCSHAKPPVPSFSSAAAGSNSVCL